MGVAQGARRVSLSLDYADAWDQVSCAELAAGLHEAGAVWMDRFRRGEAIPLDPLHTKILTHLKGGIPCPRRCLLAGQEWAVAPSGRIYPCAQMIQQDCRDDLVIGHVDHGIDPERVAELQRMKDRAEATCADCALRDRCQSHCGCRHLRLGGELGAITATLCETESAFIQAADDVAAELFAEQCPAFIDFYFRRAWSPSARAELTALRRSRDAV
ncbi:MAG: SPASM domain-containing protein [Polyangiaceae bacterium]|nr:SPASM domain-containing protein [Polyangiaceae bacterium]